jgi:hypothetical protein
VLVNQGENYPAFPSSWYDVNQVRVAQYSKKYLNSLQIKHLTKNGEGHILQTVEKLLKHDKSST